MGHKHYISNSGCLQIPNYIDKQTGLFAEVIVTPVAEVPFDFILLNAMRSSATDEL